MGNETIDYAINEKKSGDMNDPKFLNFIRQADEEQINRGSVFSMIGLVLYSVANTLKKEGVSSDVIAKSVLAPTEIMDSMGSDYVLAKYQQLETVRAALGNASEDFDEFLNDEITN